MAINKIRNDFNSSNPSDSDRIGAFLTDGTKVASINASNQLEVAVGNTVTVTATDLDIRDLSDSTDSVAAVQSGTWSVDVDSLPADVDIRDLVNTQDSVAIGDGTNLIDLAQNDSAFSATNRGFGVYGVRQDAAGSPVSADGDYHPMVFNDDGELKVAADLKSEVADDDADSGNPIKIGYRAHDITAALTSLGDGDRANALSDHYRRMFTNPSYNVGWSVSAGNAADTAAQVDGTKLDGRRAIRLQNLGDKPFEIGPDNTVTFGGGYHIPKNAEAEMEAGEALDIYVIADTGQTPDYRLAQFA